MNFSSIIGLIFYFFLEITAKEQEDLDKFDAQKHSYRGRGPTKSYSTGTHRNQFHGHRLRSHRPRNMPYAPRNMLFNPPQHQNFANVQAVPTFRANVPHRSNFQQSRYTHVVFCMNFMNIFHMTTTKT